MTRGFHINDFDRRAAALKAGKTERIHQLRAKTVQRRLQDILDEPTAMDIDGSTVTLPKLEAMTHEMVKMILGRDQYACAKDKDRIAAFKVLLDRVYGAPKQVVEMQHTQTVASEEYEEMDDQELAKLQQAYENILSTPARKTL